MRLMWLVVAIAALALNMRPPFTVAGALLPDIIADLHAAPVMASLLTTLPVVCLGAFALAAPPLRRKWGEEGVVAVCLPLLVAGSLLRAGPGVGTLVAGTVVVGAAVGMANVALPTLIKRDFPARVTQVTSVYTVSITLGSGIPAAAAVPVMHALGNDWRAPLLLLAASGLVAALIWIPLLRTRRPRDTPPGSSGRSLLRSPLAWQVTAFMGLQSLVAFVVFGWLPTIGQARDLSGTAAGFALSLASLAQVLGALLLPLLIGRRNDHRPAVIGVFALTGSGILGFFLGPVSWIWGFAVALGTGMGGLLTLALSMIGLRSGDATTAARLSSLSQAVGYLLAAIGPLLVGLLHQITSGWMLPLAFLLTVCLAGAVAGWGAGRPVRISVVTPTPEHSGSSR